MDERTRVATIRFSRRAVTLAVIAALAVLTGAGWAVAVQRAEARQRAAVEATGLLAVAVPHLPPYAPATVTPLPADRGPGLSLSYAVDDEIQPGLRVLQLKAGSDPDLCALLVRAEPEFAAGACSASGVEVSASLPGPHTLARAEGRLYADTLSVVVAHPADFTADELRARVDAARLTPVRDVLDLTD